jgi:hypothetical protein
VETHRIVRRRGSHIFSRQSAHRWPYAPADLFLPERFLVLISVRGWVDPKVIVRLEGLGQLEKIHLIGTRTRDFPAGSIVPQSTYYATACPPPKRWRNKEFNINSINENWLIQIKMEWSCKELKAELSKEIVNYQRKGRVNPGRQRSRWKILNGQQSNPLQRKRLWG